MADVDDDTPPARPARTRISEGAELLYDVQLIFLQLAEDAGRAADRFDSLADADRTDVLSLWRRRIAEAREHLAGLLEPGH